MGTQDWTLPGFMSGFDTLGTRLADVTIVAQLFQWQYIVYLILVWLLFFVGKHLYALPYYCMGPLSMLKTQGVEMEGGDAPGPNAQDKKKFDLGYVLTEADNKAMAVSMAGFLFALGLVEFEALSALRSPSPGVNIGLLRVWSVIGTVLLLTARVINDFLIIGHLANRRAIV